jgi:hypothetical protein
MHEIHRSLGSRFRKGPPFPSIRFTLLLWRLGFGNLLGHGEAKHLFILSLQQQPNLLVHDFQVTTGLRQRLSRSSYRRLPRPTQPRPVAACHHDPSISHHPPDLHARSSTTSSTRMDTNRHQAHCIRGVNSLSPTLLVSCVWLLQMPHKFGYMYYSLHNSWQTLVQNLPRELLAGYYMWPLSLPAVPFLQLARA